MSYALPSITRVPAAEKGLTIADFLVPVRVGERVSPRLRNVAPGRRRRRRSST